VGFPDPLSGTVKAQKRGLRVNFEALAWGRHINDHRDAWEAVRRIDRARAIGGSLRCSAIGTQVGRGTTAVLARDAIRAGPEHCYGFSPIPAIPTTMRASKLCRAMDFSTRAIRQNPARQGDNT
jgi:hypothetical protein